MQPRKFIILSAAGFAISALLGAVQVSANPPGVPVTAPLTCQTSGKSWQITALTGPNDEFPVNVPCTLTANLGKTCALYRYTVQNLAKLGTDHVAFSVSADQDLDASGPSSFVNPPGSNDSTLSGFLFRAFHEYSVRVNPTPQIPASISVVGPSNARVATALVKKGSVIESCLIAGPGAVGIRQPLASAECIKLDQSTSMRITRGADYCANGIVRFFRNSVACTGTQFTDVTGTEVPGLIFVGDPRGNQICGEALRHKKNSPARFTYESGGLVYEFCYDDQTGEVLTC